MSKTIRQIADELGVSKQAIQKRIAREPMYTCLQPYISTSGGTKYIEVAGENMIKSAFTNSNIDVSSTMSIDISTTSGNQVVQLLQDNLAVLQEQLKENGKQLEVKDRQIGHLQSELAEERKHSREQADKLAVLADTAQKLHAGTIKQLEGGEIPVDGCTISEETVKTEPKKGFIKRIVNALTNK